MDFAIFLSGFAVSLIIVVIAMRLDDATDEKLTAAGLMMGEPLGYTPACLCCRTSDDEPHFERRCWPSIARICGARALYSCELGPRTLESVREFYVAPACLTIRRSMSLIIARMMKPTWLRVRFS